MSYNDPKTTVLMTVYNGGPFLRTAIDSILDQTYKSFRFLIVDDASTDDSREIVQSYDDPRIQHHCLEKNIGQTAALNVGLHLATTRWIARMDADDYSAPTRFEEQMNVLSEDDSVSCLGSYAWIFRDDPDMIDGIIRTPTGYDEICRTISGSPIIHGSIMISREAILDVGAYDENFRIIADVDLYDRLLPKYKAVNFPKALLGVRRHNDQASNSAIASDEIIRISFRRLAKANQSQDNVSKINSDLLQAYVLRSRFSLESLRFTATIKDLARGLKVAPKGFFWAAFKVFIVYKLPHRYRTRLKGILIRLTSPFRSKA